MSSEWVYEYDDRGNRIRLVEKPESDSYPTPAKKVRSASKTLEDVWFWGNPMLKSSYSKHLLGDNLNVLRDMTSGLFSKLLPKWQASLIRVEVTESELLQVLRLEIDAIRGGIKNTQAYIADRLNTSQQRVSRLLLLISLTLADHEINTYGYIYEKPYVISEADLTDWKPSELDIQQQMASLKRPCAVGYETCLGDTKPGKFAVCYPCHVKLKTGSNALSLMPEWVIAEESRIRKDHRKLAIDECYKRHYGTISIDEADSYLDAA